MPERQIDATYEAELLVHKFGQVLNVDTTTDPADVYDNGDAAGVPLYPWIATAGTVSALSGSADDDGDPDTNTGAHTLTIEGCDTLFRPLSETLTLNGQTPVVGTKVFFRVNRAFVATAGAGGTNAGEITVTVDSKIVAQIGIGNGQTLQAIYTVLDNTAAQAVRAFLQKSHAAFTGAIPASSSVVVTLFRRLAGTGSWRTVFTSILTNNYPATADSGVLPPPGLEVAIGTDIRWTVVSTTQNNVNIVATFDVVYRP